MDALCHSLNQRIIGSIPPGIKVIAIQPQNIGKAFVARTQVLPIRVGRPESVIAQGRQPSYRLHRVQENGLMVISSDLHHMVETREVRFIRLAEVVVLVICSPRNESRERLQAVGSSGVNVIAIVRTGTRYIDPTRSIESKSLAVGKIDLRIAMVRPKVPSDYELEESEFDPSGDRPEVYVRFLDSYGQRWTLRRGVLKPIGGAR